MEGFGVFVELTSILRIFIYLWEILIKIESNIRYNVLSVWQISIYLCYLYILYYI